MSDRPAIQPEPRTLYWYKFDAKYGRGVFQATPTQVALMLADKTFQYCTLNEGLDTVSEYDFKIICRADEVAFDFTVGTNPVEQFLGEA